MLLVDFLDLLGQIIVSGESIYIVEIRNMPRVFVPPCIQIMSSLTPGATDVPIFGMPCPAGTPKLHLN